MPETYLFVFNDYLRVNLCCILYTYTVNIIRYAIINKRNYNEHQNRFGPKHQSTQISMKAVNLSPTYNNSNNNNNVLV